MLAAALFALTLACTKSNDDSRPTLAVSLEPQQYMLEQIVGDDYRVVTLLPNGENPETFAPSIAKRMEVDNSEAYFTIGYLPFEHKIAESSTGKTRIIKTTDGIEPIFGTHCLHSHVGHEHAHAHSHAVDAPDPHMWTSVRNARLMCRAMLNVLGELNPDKIADYEARFAAFDAHLDSLDKSFAARLEAVKDRPFMVWHPSLSYFARDYGLQQISVSQDNKEGSMSALREVIDNARADSVRVFFYQRNYDARQANVISEGVGARLVPVNPGSYDWEKELNLVVDELCKP